MMQALNHSLQRQGALCVPLRGSRLLARRRGAFSVSSRMPSQVPIVCFVLTALIIAAGCANPINARTATRYYDAGAAAEDRGDFVLARQYFHRMYVNTQIGFLGPAAEAHSLYEWARVSGYLEKREDVEWAFPRVLELIVQAKGKADDLRAPALSEFARYLYDTRQHERAVSVFHDAVAALEARGIEKEDPVGYAAFLDEYAESLKSLGRANEADALLKRAAGLRNAHPGVGPTYKPKRYAS